MPSEILINLLNLPLGFVPLLLELLFAILLMTLIYRLSGRWVGVNTTAELSRQDNPAFGISVAGLVAAMGIVVSGGLASSLQHQELVEQVVSTMLLGALGFLLIWIGRKTHDVITLQEIDSNTQIKQRNVSVGIVDAASSIASAVIIRAVLIWVSELNFNAVIAIFLAFFVAQSVLLLVTRLFEKSYAKGNQNASLQQALELNQLSVAIRHSGYLLATAIAVTSAAQLLEYQPDAFVNNFLGWLGLAIILTLVFVLLSYLARKLVLTGINLTVEIDQQGNVGVAVVEMLMVLAIALLLVGLLS